MNTKYTKSIQMFEIPETKGDRLIAREASMFQAIDPDFKRYGALRPSSPRPKTTVELRELIAPAHFSELFSDPDFLTQDQIITFAGKHKAALHPDYWTFLPFMNGTTKYVARIAFNPQIKVRINIFRYEDPRLWNVVEKIRMVVPK